MIIVFIAFIPRNEINDQFVEYFDESIEFRRHADYVSENLAGLYSIQFSLEAEDSGGISEPEFLEKTDNFSEWLREINQKLDMLIQYCDTFKRLNKNMHGDDEKLITPCLEIEI